jgi:hypothetical protein
LVNFVEKGGSDTDSGNGSLKRPQSLTHMLYSYAPTE